MLKIKLKKPQCIDGKYFVFVDADTKRTFKNKRQAQEFITRIENELNEALLFINEEFCDLTTFYRTYFLADRDFKFKYEVENHFELINNRLTYISVHTTSENYNTMILQAINVCFGSLIEVCELIDNKSRHRYDMLTRRRIELKEKIINQYQGSFNEFKIEAIYNNTLISKTA